MIIAALASVGGTSFEQAVTGLEAIERVTSADVDLVILDLNMPDVHGFEVLKFIRGQPSLHHIPVVILTTRGDQPSRDEAHAAGATLYLTKPFVPSTIASEIGQLLGVA